MENPFTKLAPEVVAHILSYLYSIRSLMSTSGVCRLWRDMGEWKEVKQLHLDFELLNINQVHLKQSKWSTALESLLPKVKLSSLHLLLPSQAPPKPSKPGLYLVWPLSLLDCGVTVNRLISEQAASLASITHVSVSGRPDNAQFEFSCHLLELCASVAHLSLELNSDKFDMGLLTASLRNKPIRELDINLSHLTGNLSSEHLAQLCQVLVPGTLQSLALNNSTPPGIQDHPYYGFVLDQLFMAQQTSGGCLSALQRLVIGTPTLEAFSFTNYVRVVSFSNVITLVNDVLPELKTADLTIPLCQSGGWLCFVSILSDLRKKFNHPVHMSLSTSHCSLFHLYALHRIQLGNVSAADAPVWLHISEEGFNCIRSPMLGQGETAPMEFIYKRLPPVGPSACTCLVCSSEYGLVKQQLINRLYGEPSVKPIRVISCRIPQLQIELMDLFPTLFISQVQNRYVKISTESESVSTAVIEHGALAIRNVCVGCGMLPAPL